MPSRDRIVPRPVRPRVDPLPDEDIDAETRRLLGDGPVLNIFRTLAVHPKLLKRWVVFGNHVLLKSTLPPRERELAILRVGWLCGSEYEWAQHAVIGRAAGLTDDEIERLATDPPGGEWSDLDRTILAAVEELHADSCLADETWEALARHYDTQQMVDFVFTVGQYQLVSMVLNTLGVSVDAGLKGFPE
ncbi:MAG: carboxymuconolactone decarboxylase family protein [Acidimicrobiia bacterium]|nr:carboxymuconolactone decarboxylase family protein [Acidimicrobiia bacterium]